MLMWKSVCVMPIPGVEDRPIGAQCKHRLQLSQEKSKAACWAAASGHPTRGETPPATDSDEFPDSPTLAECFVGVELPAAVLPAGLE